MKILLFIFVAIFFPAVNSFSQQLAAFNDNLHQFWVFDGGTFTKLEYLDIQEYQVGGILVAYIDNGSNLKIYQNGIVETLMTGSPIKFKATDYLLGYSLYQQLNVYDNGKTQILSTQCDGYEIRDSLIVWHDGVDQTIQVYYNGKIYTIEDGLIYNPLKEYKMGDNTIVYVQSSTKQLKLFYQGQIKVLDDFAEEIMFEAGRDIVAYMDIPDQAFKVFYRGEIIDLETFKPKSFKVGDDRLAYVDNLNHLKYFEGGDVMTISSYNPDFYDVVDNVVVFSEQGFFKTVCNGKVYIVERYIPEPFYLDFNTIAYLDQSRFLKSFQHCEQETITYDKVQNLELIRDLILFTEGSNKTEIYFMGQVFEH